MQSCVQLGAGKPIHIGYGNKLDGVAGTLSMLCVHSPDYVVMVPVSSLAKPIITFWSAISAL